MKQRTHVTSFGIAAHVLLVAASVAAATSSQVAYLDCVAAARASQGSVDECCFSHHPDYISAAYHDGKAPLKSCDPPFGFCHEHTVGYGYDKVDNIDTPSTPEDSITFYRCGDYRQPCSEVCEDYSDRKTTHVHSAKQWTETVWRILYSFRVRTRLHGATRSHSSEMADKL